MGSSSIASRTNELPRRRVGRWSRPPAVAPIYINEIANWPSPALGFSFEGMKPYASALLGAALLAACGGDPSVISATALGDTLDTLGPYRVRVLLGNPERAEGVRLYWQVEGAEPVRVGMKELRDGVFEGHIPGAAPFTRIQYWLEITGGEAALLYPRPPLAPFAFWVLGAPCADETDCGAGQRCDDSAVCRDAGGSCELDVDCGKAFGCVEGSCAPLIRSCTFDQGCLLGEVCSPLLEQCQVRPSCVAPDVCPLDFVCREGTCRRACAGEADCYPTEACIGGECGTPDPCEDDAQCAPPLVCDPAVGLCRQRGAALCSPCASDADCGGPNDHCLMLEDALRCGRDCSLDPCGEGYRCDTTRALAQCVPLSGHCP